jgi:hypothetical protein
MRRNIPQRYLAQRIVLGRRLRKDTQGQSLVEFVLLLPLILLMLSGLIEFGFTINTYLDIVDTVREVARFSSDDDPVHDDATGGAVDYNALFYERAVNMALYSFQQAGQVSLNPATDDIVVSVFRIRSGVVDSRHPSTFTDSRSGPCASEENGGDLGWRYYCNHDSDFTSAEVTNRLTSLTGSNLPPNTGLVLVEVYYNYDMLLALPWITAIVDNPIVLHAYSFVPNSSSEPDV